MTFAPRHLVVALLLPALLLPAGCGDPDPQPRPRVHDTEPSTPQPPDVDDPLSESTPPDPRDPVRLVVTADFSGGLCAYGACEAHVSVHSDGSWTRTWGPEKFNGTLTLREQEKFWDAVVAADLTGTPKTERTCNAWTDGMDVDVSLEPETQQRVFASSCDYDLSRDPLVGMLSNLALTTGDPSAETGAGSGDGRTAGRSEEDESS